MATPNALIAYRLIDAFTDHRLLDAGIPQSALDHLAVQYVQKINANPEIPDVYLFTYDFIKLHLVKNKIFIPKRSANVTLTRFLDITATHLRRALGVEEPSPIHAATARKPTSGRTRRSQKKKKVEEVKSNPAMEIPCQDESQRPPCDQQCSTSVDAPPAEETSKAGPPTANSRKRKIDVQVEEEPRIKERPVEDLVVVERTSNSTGPDPVVKPSCSATSSNELPSCDELAARILSDEPLTVTPVLDLLRSHSQCTSCLRTIAFTPEGVKEAIAPYWLLDDDPTDGLLDKFVRQLLDCVSGCKISVILQKIRKLIRTYRRCLGDPNQPLESWAIDFFEANSALKKEYEKRKAMLL